jgi:hypothetical protein
MLLACEDTDIFEETNNARFDASSFGGIKLRLEDRIEGEGIDNLARALTKDDSNPSYEISTNFGHLEGREAYFGRRNR